VNLGFQGAVGILHNDFIQALSELWKSRLDVKGKLKNSIIRRPFFHGHMRQGRRKGGTVQAHPLLRNKRRDLHACIDAHVDSLEQVLDQARHRWFADVPRPRAVSLPNHREQKQSHSMPEGERTERCAKMSVGDGDSAHLPKPQRVRAPMGGIRCRQIIHRHVCAGIPKGRGRSGIAAWPRGTGVGSAPCIQYSP